MLKTIFWNNDDAPTLGIESFGVSKNVGLRRTIDITEKYNDELITTYFIASLNFKTGLFKKKNKIFYLPIIFKHEEDIKNVMKYFGSLYFRIETSGDSSKKCSGNYHISEFVRIKNIINSFSRILLNRDELIDISFFINYDKRHSLYLTREIYNYHNNSSLSIEDFITDEEHASECLQNLIKNIHEIPMHIGYAITDCGAFVETNIRLSDFFNVLKRINDEQAKKEEFENKIKSIYSKKTYKITEE